MKAKILNEQGKVYNSIVLGFKDDGYKNSAVIVFNENNTKIIIKKIYETNNNITRKVFIYDTSKNSNWTNLNSWEGEVDILKEENFNLISDNKLIDNKLFEKFLLLQKNTKFEDSFNLKTEKDIANLMSVANDFHDAYVEKIATKLQGEYEIDFNTTWGCHIILSTKNTTTNITKNFGNRGEIFGTSLFFEDGFTYWTNNENASSFKDIEKEDKYIKAKEIVWTFKI